MMLSAQDAYDLAVAERGYLDPPEDEVFGRCMYCDGELYTREELRGRLCYRCRGIEEGVNLD